MQRIDRAALPLVRDRVYPLLAQGLPREAVRAAQGLAGPIADSLPDAQVREDLESAASATGRAHWRDFAAALGAATGLRVLGSDVPGAPPPRMPRGAARALLPLPNAALSTVTDQFVDQGVRLISTIRAGVVDGIGDQIVRAYTFGDGGDPADLADRLLKLWQRKGVPAKIPTRRVRRDGSPVLVSARSHAELIARDQLQKLHGKINEARQTAAGVESYRWRGELDDRERPEHVAREGVRYLWSAPPFDGHPGEPINCRCVAEAILDAGQILDSGSYVEIETADPFSERQSPAGITLADPGPGALGSGFL